MTIENLGEHFDMNKYLEARSLAIKAVRNSSNLIKPGMTEKNAHSVLTEELKILGVEKFWHPTKLRMNINSVKNFSHPSDETTLGEDDLYFIDIGPVFLNHEGDYGETFVFGNNSELIHLRDATRKVYDVVASVFKEHKLTGAELYMLAESEAAKLNLKLNSDMYGHRLGDFPHALHFTGELGVLEQIPNPKLWVLEIHLIDEKINRGAFFEDILF